MAAPPPKTPGAHYTWSDHQSWPDEKRWEILAGIEIPLREVFDLAGSAAEMP